LLVSMSGLRDSSVEGGVCGVTGVVADAQGRPLAGVLVKVATPERGLAFMVVSQAKGRYRTPCLPPGAESVQAFGPGVQSAIKVNPGAVADLMLTDPLQTPARLKRMTDVDYAKLMPAGSGKDVVASRCATCHSLQRVVSARKTPKQWHDTVDRMRDNFQGRLRPLNNISGEADLIQLDTMADYLAKNFTPETPVDPRVLEQWLLRPGGPAHPGRNLPGIRIQHEYVAMEFDLPPDSNPSDIAVDQHGVVWISEANTGMLGRYDPVSMKYTHVSPGTSHATSLAVDSAGNVWLAGDGQVSHYDPETKTFATIPIPAYPFAVPTPGRLATLRIAEGTVWVTGVTSDRIVKLEPGSGKAKEFPVPKGSSPYGLAPGPDHRIWYTAEVGNLIGRLDPSNGLLAYYSAPEAKSELHGLSAGADGNLWAASTDTGKLLRFDPHTGAIAEFTPPSEDSGPYALDVDASRNLVWFSEIYADRLARFDPRTGATIEFPLPSADSDVRAIRIDPSHPNRVWWTGGMANKIGYIETLID
jgi:streptogramin lyase